MKLLIATLACAVLLAHGCEDHAGKSQKITKCVTKMAQEMSRLNGDEEKICAAYNGMIECSKAAAGNCQALKENMQRQIDQAGRQLNGRCNSIHEGSQCPAGSVFACLNGLQMSNPCSIFKNLTAISNCLDMATKDCEQDASLRGVTGMIDQIKANSSLYEAMCGESFSSQEKSARIPEGRQCQAGPVFACFNGLQLSNHCSIFKNLTDIINCMDIATEDCELDASLRGLTGMIDRIKANQSIYEAKCGIAKGRQCQAGPVFACVNGMQMSNHCLIFKNLTAISNCLDMATRDCEQDASLRNVTGKIDQIKANLSTYEALSAPECEDLADRSQKIDKCGTKMVQQFNRSNGEDKEKICEAYNGMIKCYEATAGDCKALKDKMQQQIDQAAKLLDGKCNNAAGMGISIILIFVVSLMATKLL